MGDPEQPTRRWLIRGRVQGVGFRGFVRHRARELGLEGLVRNRSDGRVEVVARGPAARLADLGTALRRGPTGAQVTSVFDEEGALPADLHGFEIAPSL